MALVIIARLIVVMVLVVSSQPAVAMLSQTYSDLNVLQDMLRSRLEDEIGLKKAAFPMLLATPLHHWRESRDDFAAGAMKAITDAVGKDQAIISCSDCDAWRVNVERQNQLQIYNGELSLAELASLRKVPKYDKARSVATVKETPRGVEMKVISIDDGRILFYALADSSQNLDNVVPFNNYARERDRRLSGESLSYTFVNVGVYPSALFQLEFLEQWGARNQHVSGIGLSLFNPALALGLVYHYVFPAMPQFHVSGSFFYPLQNALADSVDSDRDLANSFVGQAMVHYVFSNVYGLFASVNNDGGFSLGVTF